MQYTKKTSNHTKQRKINRNRHFASKLNTKNNNKQPSSVLSSLSSSTRRTFHDTPHHNAPSALHHHPAVFCVVDMVNTNKPPATPAAKFSKALETIQNRWKSFTKRHTVALFSNDDELSDSYNRFFNRSGTYVSFDEVRTASPQKTPPCNAKFPAAPSLSVDAVLVEPSVDQKEQVPAAQQPLYTLTKQQRDELIQQHIARTQAEVLATLLRQATSHQLAASTDTTRTFSSHHEFSSSFTMGVNDNGTYSIVSQHHGLNDNLPKVNFSPTHPLAHPLQIEEIIKEHGEMLSFGFNKMHKKF